MELLPRARRSGPVSVTVSVAAGQTAVELVITPEPGVPPVALKGTLEQFDGVAWFLLGGFDLPDVAQALAAGKDGLPRTTLTWTFQEQVYRDDRPESTRWPTVHEYAIGGRTFKQLALCDTLRVTLDSYTRGAAGERLADAQLRYAADLNIDARTRSVA